MHLFGLSFTLQYLLSVYLSIHLSVYLSIYLSIYLSVYMYVFMLHMCTIKKFFKTYINRVDITFIRLVEHTGVKSEENNRGLAFSKTSLKTAINHSINAGNMKIKQSISIPMGIDPGSFWANLSLYSYEEEWVSSLTSSDKIKARHFHSTECFADNHCPFKSMRIYA